MRLLTSFRAKWKDSTVPIDLICLFFIPYILFIFYHQAPKEKEQKKNKHATYRNKNGLYDTFLYVLHFALLRRDYFLIFCILLIQGTSHLSKPLYQEDHVSVGIHSHHILIRTPTFRHSTITA